MAFSVGLGFFSPFSQKIGGKLRVIVGVGVQVLAKAEGMIGHLFSRRICHGEKETSHGSWDHEEDWAAPRVCPRGWWRSVP